MNQVDDHDLTADTVVSTGRLRPRLPNYSESYIPALHRLSQITASFTSGIPYHAGDLEWSDRLLTELLAILGRREPEVKGVIVWMCLYTAHSPAPNNQRC